MSERSPKRNDEGVDRADGGSNRARGGGRTALSRIGAAASSFLALGGLYLLCAGSLGIDECVAAGVTGALGSAWWWLLRHRTERPLRLVHAPWLRLLLRPLLHLVTDTARVAGVLLRAAIGRHPAGSLQWQTLRHGDDTPADAGRRAAATLALSFGPNGFALDLPGEADAVLMHRLAPVAADMAREWPT